MSLSWDWGKVFYRPEQVVDAGSFSKSPSKPKLVVEAWRKKWRDLAVESFIPIQQRDLYAVHDKEYVDAVFNLTESNGFGTCSKAVNESLLYTCGSMVAAARYALDTGKVGVSPTSGFHHAGWDFNSGFCTFNGLVLAAREAVKRGCRVGILDCDQHEGDGTDDILSVLVLREVRHVTFGKYFYCPRHANEYLAKLRGLRNEGWFKSVDFVIYQAGADVHKDDPLGGVLTSNQMKERDRIVFEGVREAGIPCVWTLAGGYSMPISKVVALHTNTMRTCIKVFQ